MHLSAKLHFTIKKCQKTSRANVFGCAAKDHEGENAFYAADLTKV